MPASLNPFDHRFLNLFARQVAWTAGYWFDVDVRNVSGVAADNQAITITGTSSAQKSGNFNTQQAQLDKLPQVLARATLEEIGDEERKSSLPATGKSKNSAAVLPKTSEVLELRPERV